MSGSRVTSALARFFDRALDLTETGYFEIEFDPQWRSECELLMATDGKICPWRPGRQQTPVDFSGLANALDMPIHEDIRTYYGSYWSGNFEAKSREGHVSLIQLWNPDDFDRLIANLIGHAIAKQKKKQAFTVFFANTDPDSELFLSIDNETGKVLLEEPGRPPINEVAADVATFIDRLTPLNATPAIY